MKHENDIESELGRLPKSLKDSYHIIHKRIKSSGPTSRSIADSAIAWLLCARRSLNSSDFITAVSMDSQGTCYSISKRDLLNMCCNLVVWDHVSGIFRFAHLSVQEYFRSEKEYSLFRVNEIALTRCVNFFLSLASLRPSLEDLLISGSQDFVRYVSFDWISHYLTVKRSKYTAE